MGRFKRVFKWILEAWGVHQILFTIGGTGVITSIAIAFLQDLKSLPLGWQVLFGFGVFLILLVLVWFFWPLILKNRTKPVDSAQLIKDAINQQVIEFYDSRDTLSKQRPLRNQLSSANEVWGFWRTGTEVYITQTIQAGRIKRLILPHPTGPGVGLMANALGKREEDFANEIIKLTKEAREANVPVKWFKGWIGNTLMIGNPDSDDAWIHVETFFPFSVAKDWPSFRVEKQKQKSLFNVLLRSYQQIWDASKTPTERILKSR